MSAQHRQGLKQLVRSPTSRISSKDLLEFLSSRSATTVHKGSTLSKESDYQIPKTQDALDAYFKPKTRLGDSKQAPKRKRSGSSSSGVKAILHDHLGLNEELTKFQSTGLARTQEDDRHAILEQVQSKLVDTIKQSDEVKRELKSYDRFFAELYEFFASSEANDSVAIGMSKMRHFYKLRNSKAGSARPSKSGTPEPKHFEFSQKSQRVKPKTDRRRKSPLSSSKSSRNVKSRMLSPQAHNTKTPTLQVFSSLKPSRSSTPLDQLESTSDKLEFIKLKTFSVLQAWVKESGTQKTIR